MAIIVNPETEDEWDNETKDYETIDIGGKKYRDVTIEALESDCNVRPPSSSNYHRVVESNTRFRIGSHWGKSKRIMSRRVI